MLSIYRTILLLYNPKTVSQLDDTLDFLSFCLSQASFPRLLCYFREPTTHKRHIYQADTLSQGSSALWLSKFYPLRNSKSLHFIIFAISGAPRSRMQKMLVTKVQTIDHKT